MIGGIVNKTREDEREKKREKERDREKERERERENGREREERETLRVCIQNACVCTFKTFPCVSAPRAHAEKYVHVVPENTETF